MTHREATTFLNSPALNNLSAQEPLRWADLGCGSGVFTLALAEYLPPHSTLHAIDLQPTIKKQTTPNGITIFPQTADITQPNPALKMLDGILIANAIHYVADQPAFIKMLHAILKPGGAVVLVEYDTDTPVTRWVPYPLNFQAATRLFISPRWTRLQKGNTRPSAFGRSNLYAAFATKIN
jgi:ubiquinone/menaquinone biosynthesis C-methylase UbiE